MEYIYIGIRSNLEKTIKSYCNWKEIDCFSISINVDGMSPFNSSSTSLWPILVSVNKRPFKVFVCTLTYGNKPSNCNFLDECISELNYIINNGIYIDGKTIKICLDSIICDAPARAMLKATVGHNAKNGCERCHVKGEYIENRIIFRDINATERTHELFIQKYDTTYHKSDSNLLNINNFNIINQMPLDYMHLICIGVTKKLLKYWINIDKININEVSQKMMAMKVPK